MAVEREGLLRVFGAGTVCPFGFWVYATPDPLEEVLAKGYFKNCYRELVLGDLVLCGTDQASYLGRDRKRDQRRSLLMVSAKPLDGIEVRLLQDWGTPDGPRLPPEPATSAPAGDAPLAALVAEEVAAQLRAAAAERTARRPRPVWRLLEPPGRCRRPARDRRLAMGGPG
jgi:hypothetical protein